MRVRPSHTTLVWVELIGYLSGTTTIRNKSAPVTQVLSGRIILAINTHLMTLDDLIIHCTRKQAVTEELPFGPDTLVFKVAGKMFALTGLDEEDLRVNLKCDPEYSVELRERRGDQARLAHEQASLEYRLH